MKAYFRFYAALNDFLPQSWRQSVFEYPIYQQDQSVKHVIEAIGVPHPEVALILVNGQAVDFNYLVQPEDKVSVYPIFEHTGISPHPLRPPLKRPFRFLLDNHLGRLARYLRLLGFDTLYFNHPTEDADLAQLAHEQQRVLLTRDQGLLKRSLVVYGYWLRSQDAREQLTAVLQRYRLRDFFKPWTRCIRCNGRLAVTAKADIIDRLEPKTKLYFDAFKQCQDCEQVYWKGSHYPKLKSIIDGEK